MDKWGINGFKSLDVACKIIGEDGIDTFGIYKILVKRGLVR